MAALWGEGTVFDENHPDYNLAVAAITSVLNRTGDGGNALTYLQNTKPDDLKVIHDAYNLIGDSHWDLVEIGAAMLDVHCFVAGTKISMWDGTEKPIEQVVPDDVVLSYDKDGTLKPGRVTRTF